MNNGKVRRLSIKELKDLIKEKNEFVTRVFSVMDLIVSVKGAQQTEDNGDLYHELLLEGLRLRLTLGSGKCRSAIIWRADQNPKTALPLFYAAHAGDVEKAKIYYWQENTLIWQDQIDLYATHVQEILTKIEREEAINEQTRKAREEEITTTNQIYEDAQRLGISW